MSPIAELYLTIISSSGEQGSEEQGEEYLAKAIELFEKVLVSDPTNALALKYIARSFEKLCAPRGDSVLSPQDKNCMVLFPFNFYIIRMV